MTWAEMLMNTFRHTLSARKAAAAVAATVAEQRDSLRRYESLHSGCELDVKRWIRQRLDPDERLMVERNKHHAMYT